MDTLIPASNIVDEADTGLEPVIRAAVSSPTLRLDQKISVVEIQCPTVLRVMTGTWNMHGRV